MIAESAGYRCVEKGMYKNERQVRARNVKGKCRKDAANFCEVQATFPGLIQNSACEGGLSGAP
jgi:hypothetical protein